MSEPRPPAARLICIDQSALRSGIGKVIVLQEEAVTLGRSNENTVSLNAEGVSRAHARIFPEGTRWGIRDVGSTNGILVNDTSTREAWLHHGDIVMLGKLPYRFVVDAEEDRRSAPQLDITGAAEKTVILHGDEVAEQMKVAAANAAARDNREASVDLSLSSAETLTMNSVESTGKHAVGKENTSVSMRSRNHRANSGTNVGLWLIIAGLILMLAFMAALLIR